jgi:hypothetical protein
LVSCRHTIIISFPDDDEGGRAMEHRIRDNGHGSLAAKWDHLITISQGTDGNVVYTDDVEVSAGWLTPFVWLYAHVFYRYRQYRWRRLVRRGFRFE